MRRKVTKPKAQVVPQSQADAPSPRRLWLSPWSTDHNDKLDLPKNELNRTGTVDLPTRLARRRFLHALTEAGSPGGGRRSPIDDLADLVAAATRTQDPGILSTWAKRWNLQVRWVELAAVEAVGRWHKDPSQPLRLDAVDLNQLEFLPVPGTEHLEPLAWRPFEETEAEFRNRVDAYIRAVNRAALAHDMKQAPGVGTRSDDPLAPYRWLVRFQAFGETLDAIAEDTAGDGGLSPQAISKQIRAVARLAELPLRST